MSQTSISAGAGESLRSLYPELRRMAAQRMAGQPKHHTLQATALANEALLRMNRAQDERVEDREHFFRLAARVMRHILIDHARSKRSKGARENVEPSQLDNLLVAHEQRVGDLLELDCALEKLRVRDAKLADLVELRFFAGRSMVEIAGLLRMSERQARRCWSEARELLKQELAVSTGSAAAL